MIATGGTVGLAEGIIDDTYLSLLTSLIASFSASKKLGISQSLIFPLKLAF